MDLFNLALESSEPYSRSIPFWSYQAKNNVSPQESESCLSLLSVLFPLLGIIHLKCFNGFPYHYCVRILSMYSFKDFCCPGDHFILPQWWENHASAHTSVSVIQKNNESLNGYECSFCLFRAYSAPPAETDRDYFHKIM